MLTESKIVVSWLTESKIVVNWLTESKIVVSCLTESKIVVSWLTQKHMYRYRFRYDLGHSQVVYLFVHERT